MIEIDWEKKKRDIFYLFYLNFDIKFVRLCFVSKENILFQSFLIIYSVKIVTMKRNEKEGRNR